MQDRKRPGTPLYIIGNNSLRFCSRFWPTRLWPPRSLQPHWIQEECHLNKSEKKVSKQCLHIFQDLCVPFRIAGTSSPSANSRIMVPETGEVLSSSKANLREAFFLGNPPGLILAFFEGLLLWLLGSKVLLRGLIGGEPRPTFFRLMSISWFGEVSVGLVGESPPCAMAAARAIKWCWNWLRKMGDKLVCCCCWA